MNFFLLVLLFHILTYSFHWHCVGLCNEIEENRRPVNTKVLTSAALA
jgi:hypothetical protein